MGDRAERRRQRRSQRREGLARRRLDQMSAYETKWIARRRGLIVALEEAGHSPAIVTNWVARGEGEGPRTTMICARCGANYRGKVIRRWSGLSPNRPCEGDSQRAKQRDDHQRLWFFAAMAGLGGLGSGAIALTSDAGVLGGAYLVSVGLLVLSAFLVMRAIRS